MENNELSNIQPLLNAFSTGEYSEDVVSSWIQPKRDAVYEDIPGDLHPILKDILKNQFLNGLFTHQVESWRKVKSGKNVVISTGTSSGKSLCFYIPILDEMLWNDQATSLLLFPTKALASDQLIKLSEMLQKINSLNKQSKFFAATYDGDTSSSNRITIRNNANILLSNPDMLHLGILPHHTGWERFLTNLKFVVIDEVHLYRGVFGSHFANVLRRLKRILQFYGTQPQFILTSATIANPNEFSEKLIEEKFEIINSDDSPKEERHYFFFNPPVINEDLGLRRGLIDQSLEFAALLLKNNIQSILFSRTRKTVELSLKRFADQYIGETNAVHGYRSGYLPTERRKIEAGIRQGSIKSVISTNALELGIDMGKVDAVIMMGYPGAISSFFQQAGRAGRRNQSSAAVLVASASPLDQYIIRHAEFVRGGNPENALLDPDNPLILLSHLRSAAFELPFKDHENFGNLSWDLVKPYIEVLCSIEELTHRNGKYFWIADQYPASDISLRNIQRNAFILRLNEENRSSIIGEVDFQSAFRTIHPGAVYLHDGASYLVENLDLEKSSADLIPLEEDYITEPKVSNSIKVESIIQSKNYSACSASFGELRVIEKVVGYKRIDWQTQQLIGYEELDLPEQELLTKGTWLCLSPTLINDLRDNNFWQNDANQYGKDWSIIRSVILERDENRCQICGLSFESKTLHVHHKIPFRSFSDRELANNHLNLITLCPACHKRVEQNIRIRSGLSGVAYLMANISPLFLMCDHRDIGYFCEPESELCQKQPVIAIYDQFPGGIGLSAKLFEMLRCNTETEPAGIN